ncbi:MAG: ABC transporter ATP-binding protein [Saccharofermentans sp.]|nr:ABC transporter ATP-binding protein [Saccharofermentans sp.]
MFENDQNDIKKTTQDEQEIAIRVKDVKKKFKLYYDKGTSLKEKALFWKRNRYEERTVLNGITLEIKKGETVGLIGHNGCGKSTLLKLITRILYPDEGTVEVKGRVSSLLELGAGFHPDLSGRENIYTNASIFGLSKAEIDERLQSIIDFSELGEFIDNPVRTYSSGMYMRLAFSVAINVDADVLLVDEILAVGDTNFQAKCFNKMQDIKAAGTTIVIVSHSLSQIEQICDRSVWIHAGKIKEDGVPDNVHNDYMDFMLSLRRNNVSLAQMTEEVQRAMEEKENTENALRSEMTPEQLDVVEKGQELRWGSREIEITKVTVTNGKGVPGKFLDVGDAIHFKVDYDVHKPLGTVVFGVGIYRKDGLNVYGTNTMIEGLDTLYIDKPGSFEFDVPEFTLMPGRYVVGFAIEYGQGIPVDYWKTSCEIETFTKLRDVGAVRIKHSWKLPDNAKVDTND